MPRMLLDGPPVLLDQEQKVRLQVYWDIFDETKDKLACHLPDGQFHSGDFKTGDFKVTVNTWFNDALARLEQQTPVSFELVKNRVAQAQTPSFTDLKTRLANSQIPSFNQVLTRLKNPGHTVSNQFKSGDFEQGDFRTENIADVFDNLKVRLAQVA